MKKSMIGLVGALALVAAASAMAQGTGSTQHTSQLGAKQAECARQADAKDFGIHQYQRHRFVIRCVADLPDLDRYDRD
jgi:hypothetical protein